MTEKRSKFSKIFKLPFLGQVAIVADPNGAASSFPGGISFHSNLSAVVYRKGKPVRAVDVLRTNNPLKNLWNKLKFGNSFEIDYGSGVVTNVGVLALANDFNLAAPSGAAINTLKLANWHATGTGTNAEATSDIALQTASGFGGQNPVAGAQTLVSVANSQKYRSVATIAYTGTETVTEWVLLLGNFLTQTTGSPFTAGNATSGTVTATPLTASSATVQGQQQTIFHNTASATPHWGLVTSNTTSVVTVPAWYKVSDSTAAGTFPANAEAYVIRPVLWDRRKLSGPGIGVGSGDSIQFTYSLTVTPGG